MVDPKGRKAEDGPIDSKYPLKETPSASYLQRTEWNVRESDATKKLQPQINKAMLSAFIRVYLR
jgi:hypothetical protein